MILGPLFFEGQPSLKNKSKPVGSRYSMWETDKNNFPTNQSAKQWWIWVLPFFKRGCTIFLGDLKTTSKWWFQLFSMFTPIWGKFPCWLICFFMLFKRVAESPPRNAPCAIVIVHLWLGWVYGVSSRWWLKASQLKQAVQEIPYLTRPVR